MSDVYTQRHQRHTGSTHSRQMILLLSTIFILISPILALTVENQSPITYDIDTLPDTFLTVQTRHHETTPVLPSEAHQKRQIDVESIRSSISNHVSSIISSAMDEYRGGRNTKGTTSSSLSSLTDTDLVEMAIPTDGETTGPVSSTTHEHRTTDWGIFDLPTHIGEDVTGHNTQPGSQQPTGTSETDSQPPGSSSGLSTAAIAGISAGIGVPALIIVAWVAYKVGIKRALQRHLGLSSVSSASYGTGTGAGMAKTGGAVVTNTYFEDRNTHIGINGRMPGIEDEGEHNVGGIGAGRRGLFR